jgi:hypothetical protein
MMQVECRHYSRVIGDQTRITLRRHDSQGGCDFGVQVGGYVWVIARERVGDVADKT